MSTDVLRHIIVDGIPKELSRKSRDCRQGSSIWRCVLTACWASLCVTTAFAAETYDLKSSLKPGAVQQVQAVVEVRGDLLVQAGDGEQQKLPMLVSGKVPYDERMLAVEAAEARSDL